jgi:hypothetical protein
MVGTLRKDRVEAADFIDKPRQIIIVNKFGVSKNSWCLAKKSFNGLFVILHLLRKFIFGIEEAQAVIIRFRKKLDAAGIGKLFKAVEDLGCVFFELFENNTCYAVGYFKFAVILFNQLEHELISRQVAFTSDFPANILVFPVVKIVGCVIENSIMPEPVWLMNLKVKTN